MSTAELSPTVALRLTAAERLGCTWDTSLDPDTGYLIELCKGSRRRILLGAFSPLNDGVATRLASDKFHCGTLLHRAGFRVPKSARCLQSGWFTEEDFSSHTDLKEAEALAELLGYPLLVKPNRGSRGKGIRQVDTWEDLKAAVENVWQRDYLALVQEVVPGIDVRLDFLDGEFLLGYLRRPVRLRGDGRSTVRELLCDLDFRFADRDFAERLEEEELWQRHAGGHPLDGIPGADEELDFATPILNLNRLCLAEPIEELPDAWFLAARKVGNTLALRHYGIDFKAESLESGPESATVIEVNASPSMAQMAKMGYRERALAAEEKVVRAILELE